MLVTFPSYISFQVKRTTDCVSFLGGIKIQAVKDGGKLLDSKELDQLISDIDKNGDGTIDYNEV